MKRLVVCCDGTWYRPDHVSAGVVSPTNVTKLAWGVATKDPHGTPQFLHYHRGVGTEPGERILGGAFGVGLSRHVRACYRFLVENYEPGDELYFFGFSRGAFTARSIVGLVYNAGIVRREHAARIDDAYRLYRGRGDLRRPNGIESLIFRRMYSHDEIAVHFVGVWDTVGRLGIPGVRGRLADRFWGFHDTTLNRRVRFAYHALAIDEPRRLFEPTLWKRHPQAGDQRLQQVWFSGGHGDIGGGHRDPCLAELTLVWMTQRARACGLAFRPEFLQTWSGAPDDKRRALAHEIAPDALGVSEDPRRGVFRLLPSRQRILDPRPSVGCAVASSATQRRREKPGYAPRNLDEYLAKRPVEVDWRTGAPGGDAAAPPSS